MAPRPSHAGDRAPGDHRGTPDASGAAGEAEQIPLLAPSQPSRGDSPRHLSLLGETTAPRDLPPVPSGMCRAGIPLLFLVFLPRSPLCCQCWAPRCHVPARTGGRLLGHLLTQGRNHTGTFPAAAPGGIWAPRAAPHHRDFFCSDISVSPCHLVPTRSRGGGKHAPRALRGAFCKTHAFGVFGWLQPISFPSKRAPPGCCAVAQGCALLSAVELLL